MKRSKTDIFSIIFIFVVVLVLFLRNYVPDTWLTGWDNLHPEFNFAENIINRSILGVWQEYQGFGIFPGNAHSADLLRQILLWTMSIAVPGSLLRYLYHFLMLFAGGVGMYFLSKRFVRGLFPLLSACLYILNPGTMQYFYVPYEAFSHFFGVFPWLCLVLFDYLGSEGGRGFRKLVIVNILAIPAFYIPTLFVVYMMVVALVFSVWLLSTKFKEIKKVAWVLLAILIVNLYWLAPFSLYVLRGTDTYTDSLINRSFTEEAALRNQKFGNLSGLVQFKSFLFDTTDLADVFGSHKFMMEDWMPHLDKLPVLFTLYVLFGCAFISAILNLVQPKKDYKNTALSLLFLLGCFTLLNDNPPFGFIFRFFREYVPFFKQVFRFSYTKFIVIYVASVVLLASQTMEKTAFLIEKVAKPSRFRLLIPILAFAMALFVNIPSLQGKFIYPAMRVEIPEEYFSLFDFFNGLDDYGRIANFPQPTFWGWVNYGWGYRGSGFPWYGIKQPILDRAFDVWSPENESYFKEVSYALYNQNYDLFKSVLAKYQVKYVWVDNRQLVPHNDASLGFDLLSKALTEENGFIKLYESRSQTVYQNTNLAYTYGRAINARPVCMDWHTTSFDNVYEMYGNYYVENSSRPCLQVPFYGIDDSFHRYTTREEAENTYVQSQVRIDGSLIPGSLYRRFYRLTSLEDKVLFDQQGVTVLVNGSQHVIGRNQTLQGIPSDYVNSYLINSGRVLSGLTPLHVEVVGLSIDFEAIEKSTNETEITENLIRTPINNCSFYVDENAFYASEYHKDGSFSLIGRACSPCKYAPLPTLMPSHDLSSFANKPYVLSVSFDYEVFEDMAPVLCLTKDGKIECTYTYKPPKPNASSGYVSATWDQYVSNINPSELWLKFEMYAPHESKETRVNFKNIKVSISNTSLGTFSYALPDIAGIGVEEEPVQVKVGDILSIPVGGNDPVITIDPFRYPVAEKCYSLGSDDYKVKQGFDFQVGGYVEYESKDTNICNYFPVEPALLHSGFILEVKHENISGRSLRIGVKTAPSDYYFFREILPFNSAWTKSLYFIPPIRGQSMENVFIEIDNYAVGKESRINKLAQINFYPIGYAAITGLVIDPVESQLKESPNTMELDSSFSVDRKSTFLYQITNQSLLEEKGVSLELDQTFDKGWVFVTDRLTFPRHVKINNWANGWLIEKNFNYGYAIFLPQVANFLLVGVSLMVSGLYIFRKRHPGTPGSSTGV
ncbi:MAG: hypothetical protein WC243_03580 [Patescibacteria group bacterium]|jgi:hypothetical protein